MTEVVERLARKWAPHYARSCAPDKGRRSVVWPEEDARFFLLAIAEEIDDAADALANDRTLPLGRHAEALSAKRVSGWLRGAAATLDATTT